MDVGHGARLGRSAVQALLVLMLLAPSAPPGARADDARLDEGTGAEQPAEQQAGPARVFLQPSSPFVEDPTRQAGGEDDAQRTLEQQIQRQEDHDDGEYRRK